MEYAVLNNGVKMPMEGFGVRAGSAGRDRKRLSSDRHSGSLYE